MTILELILAFASCIATVVLAVMAVLPAFAAQLLGDSLKTVLWTVFATKWPLPTYLYDRKE